MSKFVKFLLVLVILTTLGNLVNQVILWAPPVVNGDTALGGGSNDTDKQPGGSTGESTGDKEEEKEEQLPVADVQISASVTPDAENKVPEGGVSMNGVTASATVPAGVQMTEGATELTLTVNGMEESEADLELSENEVSTSLDVHMAGVAEDNAIPMEIKLVAAAVKGLNSTSIKLYHVENGETVEMTRVANGEDFTAHNQFKYDPATGDVTLYIASFSEIAVVSDTDNAWKGAFDYTWYDASKTELTIANADQLAAFGAIVGGMAKDEEGNFLITYPDSDGDEHHNDSFSGKTVKLVADINLGDDEENNNGGIIFYPIGYWNNEGTYERKPLEERTTAVSSGFYAFEGTFDGNGNTIANFYQNTWEMKGDHDWYNTTTEQYFRDGMGLFGKVYGGTVKNLTVENFSSDGEITTTGVIAAYADSANGKPATFENISIFNCNPRVYNIGNGGIVGCAGWYSRDESLGNENYTNAITFRNITVDQTNKISALWGTYDVSCGGILGQYYPNSGCGIKLENCHVAAQLDVHNDVCANYQYYWYRYSGMFIGTVRANTKDANGYTVADTTGITATGCTYTLGDWNQYWYCELVKNSLASYTHDHQFSRLTKIASLDEIWDGTNWLKEGNFVIPAADNSSATCYHIFKDENGNLYQHKHEDSGTEEINGVEILKEDRQCYFMPFNQVLSGLGYGVKAHYEGDLPDTIDIQDVTDKGGLVSSVEKFAYTGSTAIAKDSTITLDNLFMASGKGTISSPTVQVYVSPVGEDSTVSAVYSGNSADWYKGTLKFSGEGAARIVITDFFYCKNTIITVTIGEESKVEKFTANNDIKAIAGDSINIGEIFSAIDGAVINSAKVSVNVTGVEYEYVANAEDWTQGTIIFKETGDASITISEGDLCRTCSTTVTVGETNSFTTVFEHTDKFLYRVGNLSSITLSSLFKQLDSATINGDVTVTVVSLIDGTTVMTATFAKDSWLSSTIDFEDTFTGPVAVTVDALGANTYTLNLEVVDAVNATEATSATANNVVLLQNVSGSFSVSGGYALYGNSFTVTLPTTIQSKYSAGYVGYVTINNGNLDNVRIEGPVYPEMYIYRDQAQDSTDTAKVNYFYNSVYINGGNCTISNSYISGSRTAICIRGGNNVTIENTTVVGGAFANMHIAGASSVTLRDLTTVQVDTTDSYGQGKNVHGMGVYVESNTTDIYIEGELKQYNWLCEDQWNSIVPSNYQSSFPDFFGDNTFSNYWHYLNGGTDPYVNMAFIFGCAWDTTKINDNRTTVDYGTCNTTIAGVAGGIYSKVNTVGGNAITDSDLAGPGYTPTGFNPVAPVFNFDNTANNDTDDENDAADTYCTYDADSGVLKLGLTGDSKTIDLSGISITKNGAVLTHTAYLNGTQISGNSITIKSADGTKQTLTFKVTTDDAGYDKDGNPVDGSIEYTWTVYIEVATLAYPAPVWNMGGDYQFDTTNCVYAYYQTSQGYGEAVPIYEGIKINYYNKSGTLENLDLSGTTTLPTGSNNSNSNAFTYTLPDGSILTMKFSSGWKSGATTHQFTTYNNKVYIYPQSLDNDNYVRAKTTNQDFNVQISYTFTDPNGQSTETVTMNWYNAASSNGSVSTVQWKTFDSANGKAPSICLTPDTLITLADGSQKEIQNIRVGDEVLAWNFYTGKYEVTPVSLLQAHSTGVQNILHLYFEDGTELKILGEHGVFDADLNTFVFIDEHDVENYIGHSFVKKDGDSFTTVKLAGYEITTEHTTAYTILSENHYNVMAEGMFTVTPAHVGGNFFNPFDIGENMKYDDEAVKTDIEKYGLYTYEDFDHVLTYEQFVALNLGHFKVSVGKGYITYDGLIYLIENFINNEDFNVQ